MNNAPAISRVNKLLSVISNVVIEHKQNNEKFFGLSDQQISDELGWKVDAVRSTATQLENLGKVHVVRDPEMLGGTWYVFPEDLDYVEMVVDEKPSSSDNVEVLAKRMAEAIADYVKATIADRS
jgi:hypothetical protein